MTTDHPALEALSVPIYMTDAEGLLTFYNSAAAVFWGFRPELGSSRWCGSWRLYWPDGQPMAHEDCPMAQALREDRPVRGQQAIAERPDGTRIRFLACPTPLHDETGRLTGAVNMLVDLSTEYQRDVESARLAAIVQCSDDAILSKTLEGVVTSWNDSATRIFGYTAEEMVGQPIKRLIPPELWDEEEQILAKLKRGERIEHFDTRRRAKDGRPVEVSLTVSPLRDKTGQLVGASKVARDITQQKQAERLQALLLDELNHRVKNLLATIQAIASQSLRRASDPAAFVASFTGRLQALARAHDRLVQSEMRGSTVEDVLRDQLAGAEVGRVKIQGPSVPLDPQSTIHLALVLHELSSNAKRHGALSRPAGGLAVEWRLLPGATPALSLQWRESGFATLASPSHQGFGTLLIERTLESHGGRAALSFNVGGVACDILLPLPGGPATEVMDSSMSDQVAPPAEARSASPLSARRILVIEDEPLVAMELESILAAAGCRVVGPAGTLEGARRLIAGAGFDAALVDANLGGSRVDELAVALAERAIPFGFVTGYGREALPPDFQLARMLTKPFLPQQLLALVRELLEKAG